MRIRLLGTALLIAAVLVILLASEAHAGRAWSGGCTVAVDITPTAQDLYGREIANALATVTLVTGLAFEPATDHADLTYQIGDTSWLGSSVLGYFGTIGILLGSLLGAIAYVLADRRAS